MKTIRALAFAMTILSPISFGVAAEMADPLAGRDQKIIPAFLMWLQETGVKLTYLGNEGGIRGYLAESPTGNMQTLYVAPNPVFAVQGLLYGMDYGSDHSNLTGKQLDQMRQRYDAVANAVSSIDLNDVKSVQQALSEIKVPKPLFDLGAFPQVDDKAAILNKLREDGYELTVLGQEGGLSGYFAKRNGIGQTLYVTPDGQHVVAGLLVQRGGKNVTGVQLGEMRARYQSEKSATDQSSIKTEDKKGPDASQSSSIPASDAKTPSPSIEPAVKTSDDHVQADTQSPKVADSSPTVDVKASSDLSLPAANGPSAQAVGNPSTMFFADVDRKQFMEAARSASWFDVGFSSAPVTIYMVDDPNCPYCHKTWDYLKPFITERKVKIRVIMIAFLNGSDAAAREIMASPNPGLRFLESDAGERMGPYKIAPNSSEYKAITAHLQNNRKFTTKFNITATPFLAYEGKDGNFYSSRGADNLDAFFYAAGLTK